MAWMATRTWDCSSGSETSTSRHCSRGSEPFGAPFAHHSDGNATVAESAATGDDADDGGGGGGAKTGPDCDTSHPPAARPANCTWMAASHRGTRS